MAAITSSGLRGLVSHSKGKPFGHLKNFAKLNATRNILKPLRGAGDNDGYEEWEKASVASESQGNGVSWVIEKSANLTKEALTEAAEEEKAQSVGMHIRGRSVQMDLESTNEDEERRYYWHRRLHTYAEQGDFTQAEGIMRQMRETGLHPGPRAHHALIFSYVKGGNSMGALEAIQNEAQKFGVQPLPQSYTAVIHGFLQEGDLETAEAVYASNRRAGVSSAKSWAAICTALLNAGEHDRALKLLNQGEEEGMIPDDRLYEAVIKSFCRQGDLSSGLHRLQEMQSQGLQPKKDHISALVTAHALAGKTYEAETLLLIMLKSAGTSTAATIGAINALLQMYLTQELPRNELATKITSLRQSMMKGGLALDRKGYSLLLEASVYLEDPQIGLLAFRSLKSQGRGSLQYATDEVLGEFLLQLSLNRQPADLFEVLTVMSREQRNITPEMMPLEGGRSFLTAWLSPVAAESKQDKLNELLFIDGIALDSSTLCAVGEDLIPLPPNKMSVKELRAELAARQCPLLGNKKELVKQLQKARAEAEVAGAFYDDGRNSRMKKVEIIVSEESWDTGNLVACNTYEDERETEAVEDEDVEDNDDRVGEEEEAEDDNVASSLSLEEDDDFDYDDRVYAMMKAQGKFNVDNLPEFTNSRAGIREALAVFTGVIAMDGMPTQADAAALYEAIISSSDPRHAEEFLKTLQNRDIMHLMSDEQAAKLQSLAQAVSV